MLTRQGPDHELETGKLGQFIVFELPIYYILHVLNFKRVAHEGKIQN